MATIQIFHNPRCSKSRKTLELLKEKGVDPDITEYLQHPPTAEEIERIAEMLGLKPSQFVRRGEFAKLGIAMAEAEAALIHQMAEYPILIERPIVIHGNKARIGRPPESVLEIL